MTNLNCVIIQGNLTKDASEGMRRGSNDTAFGSFTLAVNRSYKNGNDWVDKTSFVKVKAFGKSYENAVKWLTRGSSAIVEGYVEQESWEKDGQKHSELVIVADRIHPTYKKSEGGNANNESQYRSQSTQRSEEPQEGFPF